VIVIHVQMVTNAQQAYLFNVQQVSTHPAKSIIVLLVHLDFTVLMLVLLHQRFVLVAHSQMNKLLHV